ncbi:MAG: tetratricopeptide repeat protein [Elusimicrobia bacterium]|nr:tetratricopeptide repeat protein [Elusimicrobiota bacterium]
MPSREKGMFQAGMGLWAILFLGAYSLSFWIPFLYDDQGIMLKHPLIIGPWPGINAILATPLTRGGEYEPLNVLLHWFLRRFAGEHVFLYRLSSLLLHGANAFLLYRLSRRLFEIAGSPARQAFWSAWAVATLFSLFPAHAEIMAVSSFKKHLAVGFFGLVMLNVQVEDGLSNAARCLIAGAALSAALLFKESAAALPFLAGLLSSLHFSRRKFLEECAFLAGLVIISLAYASARFLLVPRVLAPLTPGGALAHGLTSLKIGLWSLGQLFWPSSLCLEHSLAAVRSPFSWEGWLLAAATVGLAYGIIRLRRFDRLACCGALWALAALTPFLNLVPFLNYSLVADRYLYLASAGFLLMTVRLFLLFSRAARSLAALGWLLLAGLYSALSAAHLKRFTDPWDLWSHALACAPDNPRPHAQMAYLYLKRMRYAEAAREFEAALRLEPSARPLFYLDLGLAYAESGEVAEAIAVTRAGNARKPNPEALNNLGIFHQRQGDLPEALRALREAARLDSLNPGIRLNLGGVLLESGLFKEAEENLYLAAREAALKPKALALLGELAVKKGQPERAMALFEESLGLESSSWPSTASLARLYMRRRGSDKARALMDVFISRLGDGLAELRLNGDPKDGPQGRYLEELYRKALKERREILRGRG